MINLAKKFRNRNSTNSLSSGLQNFIAINEVVDATEGPEGLQYFFRNDDTIGESLRWYGEWARNELLFIEEYLKKGDVILDVGCNVGTHSAFFSNKVGDLGNVIAIDAQPAAIMITSMTAYAQGRKNIFVQNVAMGDGKVLQFNNLIDYSKRNNFGALKPEPNLKVNTVPNLTIDTFNFPKINLIKMDIEGLELSALKGAAKIILKDKPIIILETLSENATEEISNMLAVINYKFEKITISAYNENNFKKEKHNIFGPATEDLLICKPYL